MKNSRQTFSVTAMTEQIEDIYAAGTGDGDWSTVLQHLRQRMDVGLVTLLQRHAGSPWLSPIAIIGDGASWEADLVKSYEAEFHRHDPALQLVDSWRPGAWHMDVDLFSPQQLGHDIFRNDFLRPRGLEHWTALKLREDAAGDALISFISPTGAPNLDEAQRRWLDKLSPHLSRALRIHARLAHLQSKVLLSESILDSLNFPVLLLDAQRNIMASNAAAHDLLAKEPVRLRVQYGKLIPSECRELEQWKLACARGLLTLAPIAEIGLGSQRLSFNIVPVPEHTHLAQHWQRPLYMLYTATRNDSNQQVCRLAMIYGLTPAESDLCLLLCYGGHSPQVCAALRGVSIHTIRSQIKCIFAKTSVQRLADLTRLAHSL